MQNDLVLYFPDPVFSWSYIFSRPKYQLLCNFKITVTSAFSGEQVEAPIATSYTHMVAVTYALRLSPPPPSVYSATPLDQRNTYIATFPMRRRQRGGR